MSVPRGKRSNRGRPPDDAPSERDDARSAAAGEAPGRVPDLLRRVVGLGFSGFFMTEEVLRRALGDNLPREWVDFAAQQSERTRRELIDRIAGEIGRSLDTTDLPALAERLLRGHSIEVTARVRLVPREDDSAAGDASGSQPESARPAADAASEARSLRVTVRREDDEP